MEKERSEERQNGGEVEDTAPAVVLPSPNTQGVTGSMQGIASGIAPITPQPLLDATDGMADGLATRIEDALAEDGRFTALVPGLGISAEDGRVRLAGMVPSEGQRHRLLAAVRAVHGVTEAQDDLTVPAI